MPVKEVQHESASLNTVKKPFSKTNCIKNVVRKVSYKSAARITVNKSPLRKDRIELLDKSFRTKVLLKTLLKNCLQKTPYRILRRKCTVQTCCPKHR